jgi:ABC-type antimicrobial peptide transport system permease subunit
MSSLRSIVVRLRALFNREQLDRDLDTELASHCDLHTADNIRAGMSPAEARRAALLKLGGLQQTKENYRDARGFPFFDSVLQDLRFALRTLRKSPAFTAVAILTLALGIGANTAIFSVFYGVLLRPLPFPHPEQLVHLREMNAAGGQMNFSDPNFADIRDQARSLQAVAIYNSYPTTATVERNSTRVNISYVTRDFFRVIGVQPVQGRTFLPEEQQYNAPASAIVSYSYWQQTLGSASDFSALHVNLGPQHLSVVGVMPPGFRFPDDADIWLPREILEYNPSRTAHNWQVLARLAPGVSIPQTRPELSGIAQRLKLQLGHETAMTDVAIESLRSFMTSNVSLALIVLLIASSFFLLIACANVVNLMLAQAAVRERELSLRAALGAGSSRLVRQFLTEALLLSFIGGSLGVVLAYWGLDALLAIAPTGLPRLETVSINWTVLLFSLGVAGLIAVGLGVVCAWRSATKDTADGLNEGARLQGSTPRKQLLLRLMIAGQLVAAMVLLIGAGLMGRSLVRVLSVDPGFKTQDIATVELDLPDETQMPRRVQLLDQLFARFRGIPGVESVGAAGILPLLPGMSPDGSFAVVNPGQLSAETQALIQRSSQTLIDKDPAFLAELTKFFNNLFRDHDPRCEADFRIVSSDFFQTLGIPLISGRLLSESDAADGQHVAVISQALARIRWPNQDPVGQSIEFGNMDGDLRLLQIVGVVGDVREQTLESTPRPVVYVNYRQRPRGAFTFNYVLKTSGNPAPIFSAARTIVHDLDPQLAPRFSTLSQIYSDSLESRRFSFILVTIFSAAALLLAMAGTFGVNAYSVAQRTREIGVRTALGASAKEILNMILKEGALTAVVAILVGALTSFALTRSLQSMLFEVSPLDPITFGAVTLLLLAAVLAACYLPARRATQVDPMTALRYE